MTTSISIYNHTARYLANGDVMAATQIRLALCTSATFNASNATFASVSKTLLPNGVNGYTEAILDGVAVSTVTTNDAKLDASDVIWIAEGGNISAAVALLYFVQAGSGDQIPLAFINFGSTQTAADGTEFRITWNAGGIFTFTVV